MDTTKFYNEMASHGFDPGHIEADGEIHRFNSNGKRDRSSWYICFPDPLGGAYGDWREGTTFTWSSVSESHMAESQRQAFRERMRKAQAQRKRAQAEAQAKAAQKASKIWQKAQPASPDEPQVTRRKNEPVQRIR